MPGIPASPPELIVVARPGAELRVTGDPVTPVVGVDADGLRELLLVPGRSLKPLFGLSEERLKLETRIAEADAGA
ncbi:MAG: hypothetical protein LC802_07805, partial [Acidobacteria bacterium]|nr:hypothetical protein [Acidobacteriota bacterium]